ncbi:hypothetical protein WAI453_007720 [Rhynchosporium graminicola]
MRVVDNFVEQLVESTPLGAQNCPGRLIPAAISRTEIMAQWEELMFAGTDSTGMNIATICRSPALHPQNFQPERWLTENATTKASNSSFAFGAGSRACIARNLATVELYMVTEKMVEKDASRGAKAVQDKIEIYE